MILAIDTAKFIDRATELMKDENNRRYAEGYKDAIVEIFTEAERATATEKKVRTHV